MGSMSNPATDVQTYPTTAEVGLFEPPLVVASCLESVVIHGRNIDVTPCPVKAGRRPFRKNGKTEPGST